MSWDCGSNNRRIRFPHLFQHTRVKECLADCELLHTQAQMRWENKDYAGAKEIHQKILGRVSEVSSENEDLVSLIEESKSKIQEADSLMFVDKYLAEIKENYQQAEDLFKSDKIGLARSKYREIVSFISKHNKQSDDDFKWITEASQERVKLISE